MSFKKITLFASAILFFLASGCSDDEESPGSLLMTIDGEAAEMKISSATLTFRTQESNGETHQENSLEIIATAGKNKLRFQIDCWDWQNPPENGMLVKTYYYGSNIESRACLENNTDFCDIAFATYTIDWAGYSDGSLVNNDESFFEISTCDTASRLISGQFSVIVEKYEAGSIELTGTFQNVKYTVKK